MTLVSFNRYPTTRQLREFSVACLVALPLAGWLCGASLSALCVLAVVGMAIAVCGLIAPRVVHPLYVGTAAFFLPLGLAVGEVILALVYFGLFLPLGLVFRAAGRDVLGRKLDRTAPTYWQEKTQPSRPERYYRQS